MTNTKKPAHIAWETMRKNNSLNERYGLEKNTLTLKKIKDYLDNNPSSELISIILNNLNHEISFIAKKAGRTESTIKKFLLSAIQSVILGRPSIGKEKIKIKELIAFSTPKPKGKPGRPKVKEIPKIFTSSGKNVVKDTIVKLLLDSRSPKSGIIATLPFEFDFEKKLVRMNELKDLNFHGYEAAYNISQFSESKKRFRKQKKILNSDDVLRDRVTMYNHNINDMLMKEKSDRYSHLFMDYCGALSTNKETISHVIKNNVVQKGGLIWITLSGHDVSGGTKHKIQQLVKNVGGNSYELEKIEGQPVYQYQGRGGRGATMYVVLIRRVK